MRKYVPVLICMLFLSQSCIMGQGKKEILQNDKIEPKVKSAMTALNKQVYQTFCDNNFTSLQPLISDSIRSLIGEDFAKKFMPAMQGVMKGRTFRVFDEFYIRNAKTGDTIRLASGKKDSAYTMTFTCKSKDTYLSMLIAGDSVDEVMLTLTYGNFNGKWLLYGITGEDYSLHKKNAVNQYYYAKELQKQGYLMDAINIMGMSNHCLTPGGRIFKFDMEKAIKKFSDTLTNETKSKYPFPYTVNEVSTKPLVVNIHYEVDKGDFIPMVIYQSVINVMDTNSLAKENAQIQTNIGKIFYGMDKVNKRVFYRAYNELPNGQNRPAYYNYIQTL